MRPLFFSVLVLALRNGDAQVAFDLNRPSALFVLPAELHEVSALTDVDARTVACLQDEDATLYLIDAATGRITGKHAFGPPGDMEGLTRTGEEYYALRSDGLVYRMHLGTGSAQVLDTFRLRLPQDNLEGLGYDERMHRLIIAPKGVAKGGPEDRGQRALFAYDLSERKLLPEPVMRLSVEDIVVMARDAGIRVPTRTTPKGREVPAVKLRFSSVAIDPINDHHYLLSAMDRLLLVVDRNGRFITLHQLDASVFPKPEGITFLPDGTLLINSEGKDARPVLARFERER